MNTHNMTDEKLINRYKIPDNENLNDYAMQPIQPNSLFIKNGVMYILGGVSSGKSTLLSKLMAVYDKTIKPIILCFYAGLTPDETTTFALSTFNIRPTFIRLPTPEAMVSFFNQFRYKRLKLAELLMFLQSVYKNNTPLIISSIEVVEELGLTTATLPSHQKQTDYNKRIKALLFYVTGLIESSKINVNRSHGFIYLSEFLIKTYSRHIGISFDADPPLFITNCLVSISKGFHEQTITVDILNEPGVKLKNKNTAATLSRFQPYTFKPFLRVSNDNTKPKAKRIKLELVPSVSIFDDVAQFPLLTTERSNQWTKDLFAETRRWMNTFIIAAQRHNLLNKTLRSLTHTFFIGYSLIDDDIPRIAKEVPSNLLDSTDFKLLYNNVIKPFTFFVYNNKLGYNVLRLRN